MSQMRQGVVVLASVLDPTPPTRLLAVSHAVGAVMPYRSVRMRPAMPRTRGDRGARLVRPDAEQRGDLGGGPDERRVGQCPADPGRRGVAEKRIGAVGFGEHLAEERPALEGVQRAGVRGRGWSMSAGSPWCCTSTRSVTVASMPCRAGSENLVRASVFHRRHHLVGGGFPAQFGDQLPAFLAEFAQPAFHRGHLRQRGLAGGVEVHRRNGDMNIANVLLSRSGRLRLRRPSRELGDQGWQALGGGSAARSTRPLEAPPPERRRRYRAARSSRLARPPPARPRPRFAGYQPLGRRPAGPARRRTAGCRRSPSRGASRRQRSRAS